MTTGVQLPFLHLCFETGGEIQRFCSRAHVEGTDEDDTPRAPWQPPSLLPPAMGASDGRASRSAVCGAGRTANPASSGEVGGAQRSQVYAGKTGLFLVDLGLSWICAFTKLCWSFLPPPNSL